MSIRGLRLASLVAILLTPPATQPTGAVVVEPGGIALRTRVETDEGIFLVYDAMMPPENPRATAGYVAYWNDFATQDVYYYSRLVVSAADLGQALVALRRDMAIDLDPVATASPRLDRLMAEASGRPDTAAWWQPLTYAAAAATMGFDIGTVADDDGGGPLPECPPPPALSTAPRVHAARPYRSAGLVRATPVPAPTMATPRDAVVAAMALFPCVPTRPPGSPTPCPPNQHRCGGVCTSQTCCTGSGDCPTGERCSSGICCPPGTNGCLGYCISSGRSCGPGGASCNGDGDCSSGWTCSNGLCCQPGEVGCGDACFPSGSECCGGGPPCSGGTSCSNGVCCPPGQVGCDGGCHPSGTECCGGVAVCPSDQPCIGGQCCEVECEGACCDGLDGDGGCTAGVCVCVDEACSLKTCEGKPACDDDDPCTDDVCWAGDPATCFHVPAVDLYFFITEEENPGGFLCVNDDDDNGDGVPDKDELAATVGENDLKPLVISIDQTKTGTVTLSAVTGGSRIRVYENPDRSSRVFLPKSWSICPCDNGVCPCPATPEFPRTLYVEGVAASLAPRDVQLRFAFSGDVTCEDLLDLTVLDENPETIYLLPNDEEDFAFPLVGTTDERLCYSIDNPAIAQFNLDGALVQGMCLPSTPSTVAINGTSAGQTSIRVRVESTGTQVGVITVKVGGSINLQFDQLPTYTPWRDITAAGSTAGPPPFVTEDFHLGGLSDPAIGPLQIPESTLAALEGVPNAVMSCRVVVRNVDGHPMPDLLVVLVPVPEDGYPGSNLMQVTPPAGALTNQDGRVSATIRVANPNGFLEVNIRNWKLLILVGKAASLFDANPSTFDTQGAFLRNEVSLGDRVSNGHLIMVKREQFDPLGGTVEAAMAVSLPHVSKHALGIFTDFFENQLGRVAAPITDVTTFGQEYWRIHDVVTLSPLELNSDLWEPAGPQYVVLTEHPRPVPFSLGTYPNDPVSALLRALPNTRYDPEAIPPPDDEPLIPAELLLQARTVASDIVLSIVIPGYDTKDIVEQLINYFSDSEETSYFVFLMAVIGLSGDVGTYINPALGVPANLVTAVLKGIGKLSAKLANSILGKVGRGISGLHRLSRYALHFATGFDGPLDWVNLDKLKNAVSKVLTQILSMSDSPVLRYGGLTRDAVGDFVGDAVRLLSARGRALSHRAAEGIASFIRHGNGGADGAAAMEDLIGKLPANVADDSAESIGEAISRTYRDSPLGGSGLDPKAVERIDDAVAAGRAALQLNDVRQTMRTMIANDSFVSTVIKDERELEVLLRMPGKNLSADQRHAINIIRAAIGMPQTGQRLARVFHLNDPIGGFGALQLLDGGNPGFAGFFGRAEDLPTTAGVGPLIDRFRLDGSYHAFGPTSPYAVVETRMNADIAGKARVPRSNDFATGDTNVEDILDPFDYPGTGNGLPTYRDGYPAPEWRTQGGQPAIMDAGLDTTGKAVTVMRVRNADGTAAMLTKAPNGPTASDWKLTPDTSSPSGFVWVPCDATCQ